MLKYPSPDPDLFLALIRAYFRCLKNKRPVKKRAFHLNYESTIHGLALDIQNRSYRPGLSNIFVITQPKPHEVIAAHMRDRVVHHLLYRYMSPYWERRFVPNSYASREGKGPLQAVKDMRSFMRHHRRHQGPLYYLKVDVQSFFASIDLNILQDVVEKKLIGALDDGDSRKIAHSSPISLRGVVMPHRQRSLVYPRPRMIVADTIDKHRFSVPLLLNHLLHATTFYATSLGSSRLESNTLLVTLPLVNKSKKNILNACQATAEMPFSRRHCEIFPGSTFR